MYCIVRDIELNELAHASICRSRVERCSFKLTSTCYFPLVHYIDCYIRRLFTTAGYAVKFPFNAGKICLPTYSTLIF